MVQLIAWFEQHQEGLDTPLYQQAKPLTMAV
jgi:hypothetical protein